MREDLNVRPEKMMHPYLQIDTSVTYTALYFTRPMLKSFAVDLTEFDFGSLYKDSWKKISIYLWEMQSGSPHQRIAYSFQSMAEMSAGLNENNMGDIVAGIAAGECANIAKTRYWEKENAGYSWTTNIAKVQSLEPTEFLTDDTYLFHGAKITTLEILQEDEQDRRPSL